MAGNLSDLGQEPVYKVGEVAVMLRISEATVRRWITSGQLAAITPGKRGYRIKKSELDAYLAGIGFTAAPAGATA
jgi:excisionase family DNA binding protein